MLYSDEEMSDFRLYGGRFSSSSKI